MLPVVVAALVGCITIVLEPLRLTLDDVDGTVLAETMIERIGERLGSKNYDVIEPGEYDRRWRRYAESLGGIYDTQTGRADPEAHRLARD